jgi:simple sugar transport system permease protein
VSAATASLSGRPGRFTTFTTTWSSQIAITVAFLALWLAFVIAAPATFGRPGIYLSFAQTTPYFAIAAMTLTMVIVAGDIDLSFGSIMALGMVGFVFVWRATGSVELGVLAALLMGTGAGLVNGILVAIVGLPSLVVTIGTQFLFRGLTVVLVAGQSFTLVGAKTSSIGTILVGKLGVIPMEFVWLLLVTIATWFLLNRHRVGQNAYVIGDNQEAGRLMGIPIRRTRVILFMLMGLAAAFAGALNSIQVSNFYPSGLGAGYLLPALAAVFVGGTSVFGGRGSVFGTFLGAFMIGGIQAGVVAAGLTEFYTQPIYGAVILVAVMIHSVLQRRFRR